jgi:hypothetical protein
MTRQRRTKKVDRPQAATYLAKARRFRADAEAMAKAGDMFSPNGVGVLCIHAAIAFADALCIRAVGEKSTSGQHTDAVHLLENTLRIATDADRTAIRAIRVLLLRKDEISYTTTLLKQADSAQMVARLATFADWAESRYAALS